MRDVTLEELHAEIDEYKRDNGRLATEVCTERAFRERAEASLNEWHAHNHRRDMVKGFVMHWTSFGEGRFDPAIVEKAVVMVDAIIAATPLPERKLKATP